MSEHFRQQGDAALSALDRRVTELELTNCSLGVLIAVYRAYFGELPAALDKRLAIMAQAKFRRVPPPSMESWLHDAQEIVSDFKRNEQRD